MVKSSDKKPFLYLSAIVVLVFLAIGLIWYFSHLRETKKIISPEAGKEVTEQQLKELEQLRKGTPLLTEEEVKAQLKELEKLRSKTKPQSPEELQKQLEELNKLKTQ